MSLARQPGSDGFRLDSTAMFQVRPLYIYELALLCVNIVESIKVMHDVKFFLSRLPQVVSGTSTPSILFAPARMLTEALGNAVLSTTLLFLQAVISACLRTAKVIVQRGQQVMRSQRRLRISVQKTTVVPILCMSLWTEASDEQWDQTSSSSRDWSQVS